MFRSSGTYDVSKFTIVCIVMVGRTNHYPSNYLGVTSRVLSYIIKYDIFEVNMGATIGKNLDNGMTSITFDSTGRTVQFTKEESIDFDERMKIIRMEGKLQTKSTPLVDNPFSLYMDAPNLTVEDIERAIIVSHNVKKVINDLVSSISELEITSEYDELLFEAAQKIIYFYNEKVGLSDTASREAVVDYFEDRICVYFDAVDWEPMKQQLWQML